MVHALAARYRPDVYAHASSWADAEEDVVQGVVAEMLLRERQLDYMMETALELEDFRNLLAFQARRYLARGRQRTVIDNLLDRAKELLVELPFERLPGLGRDVFRLPGIPSDTGPTDEQILRAARAAALVPRVPVSDADRAPTVYTAENLRSVLLAIAETLGSTFSIRDLNRIFEKVLTDWVASFLYDFEEAHEHVELEIGPEERLVVQRVTEEIVQSWSEREQLIVQRKLENVSDELLAAELGLSRPTVSSRKKDVMMGMRSALEGLPSELQEAVIDAIAVRLVTRVGRYRR